MTYLQLPVVEKCPAFPDILAEDLHQCYQEHRKLTQDFEAKTTTRKRKQNILSPWREFWLKLFMQDSVKFNVIIKWLADTLFLPVADFHEITHTDSVDLFLSVYILICYGETQLALHELSEYQRHLALKANSQRNFISDAINEVEEELDEALLDPIDSSSENPFNSNPKDLEVHLKNCNEILQTFLLKDPANANPSWDFTSSQQLVATTIQTLKKIPDSVYESSTFVNAVAKSGLAATIIKLAEPAYSYVHGTNPHHAYLLRLHGFGLVLGDLLDKWTPKAWSTEALKSLDMKPPPPKYNQNNRKIISTGAQLFKALKEHPNLIPNISNPGSVFFLSSEESFTFAWNHWLSWYLDKAGYKVFSIETHDLYNKTMAYLGDLQKNQHNWKNVQESWPEILQVIIQETLDLRKVMRETDQYAHARNPKPQDCKLCANKTPDQKCVQEVQVVLNQDPAFVAQWRGVGVTKVPQSDQMKPRPAKKAHTIERLVHPDKIETIHPGETKLKGLRHFTRNENTVKRCGRHIYLFKQGDELKDFLWYEAFARGENGHDGIYERLVHYIQTVTGVKSASRGARFAFWTSGQMIPFGPREPTGGWRADHYTYYAGIEAETVEGILILFEQAKMSAILLRTARSIHPQLAQKIQEKSKFCEKVGMSGVNLFNCHGYTAPLHKDPDHCPSLSAQFTLRAEKKWGEFGFCVLQYGYYFDSAENTLWSFDSSLLHGTVLPSEKTISNLRGGAGGTASDGVHVTIRGRDEKRATRNEEIRGHYDLRKRAWTDQ
ncbi:hypothetical protein BDP27DRAFT_1419576 [Rhodocollybia butyracea]|uniref:Uncharacterized protein n=1 Tax=Rhodocollybia butyracea TaxID=206335 RepID=A0A9P5UA89_9AGAR|nr:hypothetical protein BDP27DRAFT_1419576 [Rhodocollybia butyracea]